MGLVASHAVNHPYGHRKYETFAALAIVMMVLGCLESERARERVGGGLRAEG